jgi:hypothetical protein
LFFDYCFDIFEVHEKVSLKIIRAGTLRCGKLTQNIQRAYKVQQVAIAIFEQNILLRDKSYSLL